MARCPVVVFVFNSSGILPLNFSSKWNIENLCLNFEEEIFLLIYDFDSEM